MMSEEHFQYVSSCHISNRYENTTTFCSKTTPLVSLQADFHICMHSKIEENDEFSNRRTFTSRCRIGMRDSAKDINFS